MPDYNPDREGHVQHKFIVQKAWPSGDYAGDGLADGIQTSKGVLKPDSKGRMVVRDAALAREIQSAYPADLAVTRMRAVGPADKGHRYHFGGWPEMPWKRQREQPPEEAKSLQDEAPEEAP
jgi:hypothetical protein